MALPNPIRTFLTKVEVLKDLEEQVQELMAQH